MVRINFKNISTSGFHEDALTTTTSGDTIFNFGRMKTTGDLSSDISAFADDVTIRNFSHIETFGLGAPAIFAIGQNVKIDNYGYLATYGGVFDPDGAGLTSDAISVVGDGFYIANHGTVRVEGAFSSALVGVGTGGLIVNYGQVQDVQPAGAEGSVAVGVIGDGSKAVNLGDIVGTGDGIAALLVRGEAAVGLNGGNIQLTGDGNVGMLAQLRDADLTNKSVIKVVGDDSFGMLVKGDGYHISNSGSIETHGIFAVGIAGNGGLFFPAGQDIVIVNDGRVSTHGDAAVGVALGVNDFGIGTAVDGTVENHRSIVTDGDGAVGVLMIGSGHHLVNSGLIATDGGAFSSELTGELRAAGVAISGDDALVENSRSGVIESMNPNSAAVEMNVIERDGFPTAEMSSRLENSGIVKGASVAIQGGAGQERVVNHGQIVGNVMLGGGDDTFVFGKGGHVVGDVKLGAGDDHVVVENGSGVSHITDLSTGDTVDVSAFFSNLSQLANHIAQQGSDVVVSLSHNDTLILEHTQIANLHLQDMFLV